jgi:Tfp pilus assembly protein PilE
MKKRAGFTVIEILIVAVVLFGASGLFLYEKNHIQATNRDERRKADINTLYYNLEKIYYAQHNSYPRELNASTLSAVQPDTFKDPDGIAVNESKVENAGLSALQSTYHYEPTGCSGDTCTGYTLRADMQQESDYVKKSDHPTKK